MLNFQSMKQNENVTISQKLLLIIAIFRVLIWSIEQANCGLYTAYLNLFGPHKVPESLTELLKYKLKNIIVYMSELLPYIQGHI